MAPAENPTDQYHFSPETYAQMIRESIPRYEQLQRETIEAIPFAPARVLELGVGTGETTRRLLERFPDAAVTGLDSTPEMVFRARELGIEVRLARMEDPLPDGPWDLVVSVLTIHHLRAGGKKDLFRRVREQSRALVLGDVVEVAPERRIASVTEGFDFPPAADDQAEWCGGEVVWEADDLAVIRASYQD
ncbi:MAG: class I SAM-dependent methyltransferase [bacterium]